MGYIGQSMSERASEAYDYGAKPKSKWTKSDILQVLKDEGIRYGRLKALQSLPASVLKDELLVYDSWHHTGSMYNKTKFYTVDVERADTIDIDELLAEINQNKSTKPETPLRRKCTVNWIEFEGTRKHPVAVPKVMANVYAEEHGAYTVFYKTMDSKNEIMRKKTNGNYITITYTD